MFEFAAAIAGVSAGLFAVSLLAIAAAWRMLRGPERAPEPPPLDEERWRDQAQTIVDLEDAVERLDRTVAQTAGALTTLVELLERELR